MWRHSTRPREGYKEIVESQGLVFYDTPQPDGSITPYWPEDAYYEFTNDEILHLEGVTARLYAMCLEAAKHMASGEMGDLGLHPAALELIRHSLATNPVSIYSRFDLRFGGDGPAKMFEINGDTPTGLVESAVAQYFWLKDVMPESDQWNSLHERLVAAWVSAKARLPGDVVHFAHFEGETSGEEWMTVAYMQDTCNQAGLNTQGMTIEEIGWDSSWKRFVDRHDRAMESCFKLYPWENMLRDRLDGTAPSEFTEFGEFGKHVADDPDGTRWIEPVWKSLLSNKALLAALWQLYPNHENLLPAFVGDTPPHSMPFWIAKPLFGREGDGMRWSTPSGDGESPTHLWGDEGFCYQEWMELPSFDGYLPVLGSWVVDGKPAGLGIRESQALVTDNFARFIPHVMDAPAPTPDEVAIMSTRDEETFRKTEPAFTF